MTNLLWPGDHRAGALLTDTAVLRAMVDVESAWLQALAANALVPSPAANCDLLSLLGDTDLDDLSTAADAGGNPIIPLVTILRERAPEPTRKWIHRGLTSQDVVDTALMLALRDTVEHLRGGLASHIRRLANLADGHRSTAMVARTLTQPAVPTTFGVKVTAWLTAACDAAETLESVRTPVQIGGAAGTLAAVTEIATPIQGPAHAAKTALALADDTADALRLERRAPWHTSRAPITTIGDALVGCTDAWGRIAADVLTLGRPEIGELAEGVEPGRGGSSTMPDKSNPVLSILIRRAALAAPPLATALHTAAALANDERPDGAWHAEWDTVRTLGRRTLVAASHAGDLLNGLRVDSDRMLANLKAVDVSGEQRAIAALTANDPATTYLGAADAIIDRAVARAHRHSDKST
ncbi:lyase family protein [Mycolicibacterium austroafricanum]|uniref:lyase family protein n=1 Tax=Mycolicibacterium austroafricanum TaxID=39687 RepID=UPI00055AF75D|nr:lyase family protein [Mycolicibacterium austroafricanum]QZY47068.1 3-carboxy-cis,cis-muconate cycloisomerase [Mycolicibacterium austroafricanum]